MTKFRVYANACDFGVIEATDEQHARDIAAQMAGYASEANLEANLGQPSGIVAEAEMLRSRAWIKAAVANDRDELFDGIRTIFNCREVSIDADGDVWIADPQRGHWLGEDDLADTVRRLEAGI